jgi:hypothetical protein
MDFVDFEPELGESNNRISSQLGDGSDRGCGGVSSRKDETALGDQLSTASQMKTNGSSKCDNGKEISYDDACNDDEDQHDEHGYISKKHKQLKSKQDDDGGETSTSVRMMASDDGHIVNTNDLSSVDVGKDVSSSLFHQETTTTTTTADENCLANATKKQPSSEEKVNLEEPMSSSLTLQTPPPVTMSSSSSSTACCQRSLERTIPTTTSLIAVPTSTTKRAKGLPERAVNIMKSWYEANKVRIKNIHRLFNINH